MIKSINMKLFIVLVAFSFVWVSCTQEKNVKILNGYIVYILPNKVRFVETKREPDTNYVMHFESSNFKKAMAFSPNCHIEEMIKKIKPDTLLDENPDMLEFATFLRKPLIFPAQLTVYDTSKTASTDLKKFKMIYNGKNVEFSYVPFEGIIIDIHRIQ